MALSKEIRDKIIELRITGDDKTSMNQMLAVLDLPDDVFDKGYEKMSSAMNEIVSNQKTQKEILDISQGLSKEEISRELEIADNVISEIRNINGLSENKKNFLITIIEESVKSLKQMVDALRERVFVKVMKSKTDAILPTYAHPTDAGADVYAVETVEIQPGETKIINTGLKVAIPEGYMIQIYPRSGMSLKTPLRIANSVGIIDSEYRGDVGVIMTNTGTEIQTIEKGDRIAQMIVMPAPMIAWTEVDSLDVTSRGEGGFGSSGKS